MRRVRREVVTGGWLSPFRRSTEPARQAAALSPARDDRTPTEIAAEIDAGERLLRGHDDHTPVLDGGGA